MKKSERIITYCIVAISLIAVLIMGINLEVKMSKLSEIEPVVVFTPESTVTQHNDATFASDITETVNHLLDQITSEAETTQACTELTLCPTEAVSTQASSADSSIGDSTVEQPVVSSPVLPEAEVEQSTTKATVNPEEVELFVTKSGTKFHIAGCAYLSKSCIPITYQDAIEKGYSPCSRCFKSSEEQTN